MLDFEIKVLIQLVWINLLEIQNYVYIHTYIHKKKLYTNLF